MIVKKTGFSMIEIMVVVAIMLVISAPLIDTLRTGADTSLRGMMKIETTLEARTIIQQVQQDIKSACLLMTDEPFKPEDLSPDKLIRTIDGNTYEFYRFSSPEDLSGGSGATDSGEKIPIKPTKILYSIEKGDIPSDRFLTLTRREIFPQGHPLSAKFPLGRSTVLSKNVNFFHIEPRIFACSRGFPGGDPNSPLNQQCFFQVTLQLTQLFKPGNSSNKSPEESWKEGARDIVIADFFDTVYCEFFNQLVNRFPENRNWYHQIKE